MKKIVALLAIALVLSGCSDAKETVENQTANDVSTTDSLDDSFYRVVNLNTNLSREDYYTAFGNTMDFQTIGRELQILSTDHFSTNDYYMSEGQYLKTDDMNQLLKRSEDTSKYPYTLQAQRGTTIGGVANPIMVSTVHEQDYYEKNGSEYVLKGLSLAIVLDPRDEKNERLDTSLDESLVVDFGREAISKLYKYLQSKKDLKDIPANICVYYATNTNESDINGRYILKSYCDGSVGNIETLDYKNYMFTSKEATAADEDTASQFEIFKSNMKKAATEAVGVIGYGRYKNGQIQSMKINLKVNIKTYTELLYLISTAADELNTQFSGFDIKVLVSSQDQLEALIVKDKGEDAKSILLY